MSEVGPSSSSDILAVGTNVVSASPAVLTGVICIGGSAASTITVYDSSSAGSGKVLAQAAVPIATTTHLPLDIGVVAIKGLVCVVAGTGAQAIVHFERA